MDFKPKANSCGSNILSLIHLHTFHSLPSDVVNIISEQSNLICCEGKIQSELIDLWAIHNSTICSKPQFHESNIIVVKNGFVVNFKPLVLIFNTHGEELRRFQIAEEKRVGLHLHQFALIGNDIFLIISRSESAFSNVYDFIVVYDLQGNFKNQWPTKFSGVESIISSGENILLTTKDCVQVFDRHGHFSHKFGDYELWKKNQTVHCLLSRWTDGHVLVSCRETFRLFDIRGILLQEFTFADFGITRQDYVFEICVTQWNEIFVFLKIHRTQCKVLVFKHVSSKIELQRTFVINVMVVRSAFSFPNGSIFRCTEDLKTYVCE